jgi:beta-aspartyl-peptidase (threonine type)
MKPVIVIHGGAGVISRNTAPEKIEQYLLGLKAALKNGFDILENGGSALDATTASVVEFENNPLYNAGRGAVYTSRGTHELDAAIMDGRDRNFGAACTVQHIKHPIKLARKIMEQSPHIFFSGEGAETFGKKHKLEFVENSFFDDKYRYQQFLKARQEGVIVRDHDLDIDTPKPKGTVGAVAVDIYGNLAAATSTGGTTNKSCGRVGDTPIPGAGTFADNQTCAVSCTGFGEEFMKKAAAYDIHARMLYNSLSLEEATRKVVFEYLEPDSGGLIAVDRNGNFAMPFNTPGMFRGYKNSAEDSFVKIWE